MSLSTQRLANGSSTSVKGTGAQAEIDRAQSEPINESVPTASGRDFDRQTEIGASALGRAVRDGQGRVSETRTEGATTGAYFAKDRLAVKKSKAELAADIAELGAAWPKNAPPGADPEAFVKKADALDVYKSDRLEALGSRPAAVLVAELIDEANAIHGKAGHRQNLEGMFVAFLSHPATAAKLGAVSGLAGGARDLDSLLPTAAQFLNLADLEIPTRLLSAKRRLTDQESERYMKPRTEMSAQLFRKLELGTEEIASLIADVRPSAARHRSPAAQMLQLFDDVAALAAKPFFQVDGRVDTEKLVKALGDNAQKAAVEPELVEIFSEAIRRGLADQGLVRGRSEDLYVRT